MGILETNDESASSSDETLCGGVENSKVSNELTKDFLKWNRSRSQKEVSKAERPLLERYEEFEEKVLNKLEAWLSYMDNFVAIQAIFPSIEKRTKNSPLFRPLNFCIRQVAKIYIVMILIYLKRFLVRLRKINRLISVVKTEAAIIRGNFLMKSSNVTEYHEKCLRVLYTEKVKAIVEIVGYFNDLLLNLGLVLKRFRLGRMMRKTVGFISWIVNIYRLCRDERQDAKNDAFIRELQVRTGL